MQMKAKKLFNQFKKNGLPLQAWGAGHKIGFYVFFAVEDILGGCRTYFTLDLYNILIFFLFYQYSVLLIRAVYANADPEL